MNDLDIVEYLLEGTTKKELVIVDIQPDYKKYITFNIGSFVDFLNKSFKKYERILYLFNGTETVGMDDQGTITEWLMEYGLNEEVLNNIEFYDKGYAFLRNAMDEGINEDEIIHVLEYMISKSLTDSRDLDEDNWIEFSRLHPKDVDIREYLQDNEDSIYIPDVYERVKYIKNNFQICGGGKTECLAEMLILMKLCKKKYSLLPQFVY